MSYKVGDLEVTIVGVSKDAVSSLNEVIKKLDELQEKLKVITTGFNDAFNGVFGAMSPATTNATVQYITEIQRATEEATEQVTELNDAIQNGAARSAEALGTIGASKDVFGFQDELLWDFTDGINELFGFKEGLIDTTLKANSLKEALQLLTKPLEGKLRALLPLLTKLGQKASSFFSKLNGKYGFKAAISGASKFLSSLKRIAMYRAIRYVLSLITNSFKEGLENVVQYSSSANTVVSNLTSKFTQLKNSIGAAVTPLLQLITPALISLANVAMDVADALNQVFSVLAGNSTYIKANTDYWQDYAKSAANAKNSIMGFDEINKLGDNSTDYDSMFETVELDAEAVENKFGWIIDIVKKIQTLFSTIGDGISDLAPSIEPFSSLLGTILDCVNEVAAFFTETIVPIINTLLPYIVTFINELEPLLKPVLNVIGSILNAITPIVEIIMRIVNAILPALVVAFEIGFNQLSSFFDLIGAIFNFVWELVDTCISWFEDMFGNIINFFKSVFMGDWESAWHSLANIGISVVNALISGFESFVNFFVRAINAITGGLSSIWTWTGLPAIPSITEVSFKRLSYYYKGGFPAEGEFFVAREAGAEMVGSIGGHAAVATNDDIVASIKQGVKEAMQESDGQGGDWTIQIINDGKIKATQVITAAQRRNQRDGKTVIQLG